MKHAGCFRTCELLFDHDIGTFQERAPDHELFTYNIQDPAIGPTDVHHQNCCGAGLNMKLNVKAAAFIHNDE